MLLQWQETSIANQMYKDFCCILNIILKKHLSILWLY